ncbi:tetratricopeptide repeat protein 16-like [Rhynchocyon petersi]
MLLRGGSGWAAALSGYIPPLGVTAALELDKEPLQSIFKPPVIPVPKDSLKRIFGTSRVFQVFEDSKPKLKGLTVPLKVREYYFQGQACLEQEDWEMAVLYFSRALHLDPKLVEFYALRAEAYIQLCDFSSAAQNLRRACSLQPENTTYQEQLSLVLYLQGQCLFEQCAYQDALNIFSQAAELQPEKSRFQYRCMACLLALKRHQDCLTLVTKELKCGAANADIYLLRARLYNFFHKPNLCYRDIHKSLLLEPTHPQAKSLLKTMVKQAQQACQDATTFAVQGNTQNALRCINFAIENNPLDPSLFLFRGTMYRRLHEYDSAVEDFLKALDMVPASQEGFVQQVQRQLLLAYNDFAVHCYMQGAYQEGVLLLNKALRDEQQEKGLYINRGDCFFQMGNLAFAEADYQQALALSPRDPGARLRMAMLQEKMGFCEQRHRQFQKAEDHFSLAIHHAPHKAQYYLQRAKSRQQLQDFFGARQDVATVLLLEPKQPQLLPLLTNLFPGMSVDDVLGSQVASLAKLQLKRAMESSLQFNIPEGIVGVLREREIERQKARDLQKEWRLEPTSSREQQTSSQALQEVPEEAEVLEETAEEEEEPMKPLGKEMSLSSSYLYQTSSSSILGFPATSTAEMETSSVYQEYRSTSASAATFSDSSLKTESSDSEINRGDPSVSPRASRAHATLGQSWSLSKSQNWQSPQQQPSKTEDSLGTRQGPSETKETQDPRQTPSKTRGTQDPRQGPSKTKETQDPRPRSKRRGTQRLRRRLRNVKASQGQSCGPNKFPTHSHTWGLDRSSSKTKDFSDLNESSSKKNATQGGSLRSSKAEAAQGEKRRPSKDSSVEDQYWYQSSSADQIEVSHDTSQKSSKADTVRSQSQRLSIPVVAQRLRKAEIAQGWRHLPSPRPSKIKAAQGPSHNSSETEAMQGPSLSLYRAESSQSWNQGSRQSSIKSEALSGPSPNPSNTEYTWNLSSTLTQGSSQPPSKTKADWDSNPSRNTAP